MTEEQRRRLRAVKTFAQLIAFLRDELDWPIDQGHDEDDLTFDWSDDLGLKEVERVSIKEIKQLRPLETGQPWGIFFVNFEKKNLPIVILRRILNALVLKKRANANKAQRAAWQQRDLLFISAYGQENERQLTFAHFSEPASELDASKATLRVLGWDDDDTSLKLDHVADTLKAKLTWPKDTRDLKAWRQRWGEAFELRHGQVIDTAEDLALRLAELAKRIRNRMLQVLPRESENGELRKLLKGFQAALIHDLDEAQFADMYAQTITYGLFSAAVSRTVPGAGTSVHQGNVVDMVPVTNPFLREMLSSFLKAGGQKGKLDFDELGIQEVVDLLNDPNTRMDAVLRDFGNRTRGEDPVIHFYEAFLKAYDKKLKVQRGVFYTPQPVVSYIVRSVHELLQTEFGLVDGLADTTTWGEMLKKQPNLKLPLLTDEPGEKRTISPEEPFVQILDPATGTATFLVEVIDVIYRTMVAKWKQQRLTEAQQRTAWNEYVPRHLLPRLHAFELMMAPYAIAHMKVGLKLSETGYRFGTDERARIYLTNALEPWVKQLPLIGFDALAHEASAVNEIKRHKRFTVVIGNPPYQGFSANTGEHATKSVDVYRHCDGKPLGERNPSWLLDDYVKFLRLGQQVIAHSRGGVLGMITNNGYIDNPTFRGMRESLLSDFSSLRVFNLNGDSKKRLQSPDSSEDVNVFSIQQGVAIGIFSKDRSGAAKRVQYSELWGSREFKLKYLGEKQVAVTTWETAESRLPFFLFRATDAELDSEFHQFVSINDLFGERGWGFKTRKDYLLVDFDRKAIRDRFARIAQLSPAAARKEFKIEESAYWSFEAAHKLIPTDPDASIRPVLFRPFDVRFVFYEKYMIERGDHKFDLMSQMFSQNIALITVRRNESNRPFDHVFCTRLPAVLHSVSAKEANFFFPFFCYNLEITTSKAGTQEKFFTSPEPESNCKVKIAPYGDVSNFHYIYAVLFSSSYRARYADQLRTDFPRLPSTGNLELFGTLAQLGGELTALHLLESPKLVHPISTLIGSRHPEVEKISWSHGTVWVNKAQTTGFQGVREDVWNFHIGGYQVCEKWLKDRKGRTLSKDDIAHYQKIVVALSDTIRLMAEIDRVIDEHGGWPGAFQTVAQA
jgi:predicted helicase